ncbi:MAG: type I methionyl aminopeptidase [Candidatus Methylomirabilales bacterium]
MEHKAPWEIELLRKANRLVAEALQAVAARVAPGVRTRDLDTFAEEYLRKRGAQPAFKGYRNYPFSLCVSVNEEVVHGLPSERRLKAGDLVSLDLGTIVEGYYGDFALTVPVGEVSEVAARLLRVTEEALLRGIGAVRIGGHLSDISHAVQCHVEAHGFSVVRIFVGHGIGKALHEDPQIPNYGPPGTGPRLRPGMVLAIEPMVNAGGPEVEILPDNWTAVTKDRSLSAHFEHTIALTEEGVEILTQV